VKTQDPETKKLIRDITRKPKMSRFALALRLEDESKFIEKDFPFVASCLLMVASCILIDHEDWADEALQVLEPRVRCEICRQEHTENG
jgi:hypothetical protein